MTSAARRSHIVEHRTAEAPQSARVPLGQPARLTQRTPQPLKTRRPEQQRRAASRPSGVVETSSETEAIATAERIAMTMHPDFRHWRADTHEQVSRIMLADGVEQCRPYKPVDLKTELGHSDADRILVEPSCHQLPLQRLRRSCARRHKERPM